MSADTSLAADARRFRLILDLVPRQGDEGLAAVIEACVEEMFGAEADVVPTSDQVRELIDLVAERIKWQG